VVHGRRGGVVRGAARVLRVPRGGRGGGRVEVHRERHLGGGARRAHPADGEVTGGGGGLAGGIDQVALQPQPPGVHDRAALVEREAAVAGVEGAGGAVAVAGDGEEAAAADGEVER